MWVMTRFVTRGRDAGGEYHIVLFAAFFDLHRPRRAALGMAGCQARGQRSFAEFDLIAVMQHAVGFDGLIVVSKRLIRDSTARVSKRLILCQRRLLTRSVLSKKACAPTIKPVNVPDKFAV